MSAGRRMRPSYGPSEGAASIRDTLRALRESGVHGQAAATPLELMPRADEPPRIEGATPIEGDAIRARAVPGAPIAGFAAFLDGIQRSTVVAHAGMVPLVHGTVGAAIRERVARRARTWDVPVFSQRLYAPLGALDEGVAARLVARLPVHDTDAPGGRHPGELTALALTAVQRAREEAERGLAAAWIAREERPLLVDGGIAGLGDAARSAHAIGVVKSHRTLYAPGDALGVVLGLKAGERTTAMGLSSPRRVPVASWYLRLREGPARGPLFGLVRVEVARDEPSGGALTARADLVSRWILAERAPVSLPDPRWDVLVYGIHECEEYLSAILR